jgi:hypothetical protein
MNPVKGEVGFEAGGESYTLRYSIDALCELEAAAGMGTPAIARVLADEDKLSLTLLRQIMWAGLRDHHPDVDLKAAGELIVLAGGASVVMGFVERAFELAFPPPQEGDARPQTPGGPNGIGPASTKRGAASGGTKKHSGEGLPENSA